MSKGRLQLGIGRGVSPFEVSYFGVDNSSAQSIYLESYEVLMQSLTQSTVTYKGAHFEYTNVPIVLKPFQKPHPPLWYGVGHPEGVDWCIANQVNAVVNGPIERVKLITDRFRKLWRESPHKDGSMPLIGTSRHVIISESNKEAENLGKAAYEKWYASFMHLFNQHKSQPQFNAFPSKYEDASRAGLVIAGNPQTVCERLAQEIEHSGVNYLLARFAFGNLSLKQSLESTHLFSSDVMPNLQAIDQ